MTEHIKKQINEEAIRLFHEFDGTQNEEDFVKAASYGYSLAEQEIHRLQEQNARLRRWLEDYDKDYAKKHGIV